MKTNKQETYEINQTENVENQPNRKRRKSIE